jgi:hypothetical protein
MSDQHDQAGHDHASQDDAVVGGYGDQGEAEALVGDSPIEPEPDTDPVEDPKADPAEGTDPENPHGL